MLDNTSELSVYLGPSYRQYRIFRPEINTVERSKHVTFDKAEEPLPTNLEVVCEIE